MLWPVLLPLGGAAGTLLLMKHPRLQRAVALLALLTALAASARLLAEVWRSGQPVVYQLGGWAAPFGITLMGDLLAVTFALMAQTVLLLGLVYALGCRDKVTGYPTFYPLFLTLTTGLSGAFLTGDLFNLFVFAELLVFSGTILTAVSDDPGGVEAALKYFFISLLASACLLLANGLLYATYGTLNMADLAVRIAADGTPPLLPLAIALLLATFMIKSAVFPFHFWQPDFHAVSTTAVSAMLSSVVVKLGVYGFLRMTTLLFVAQAPTIRALLVVAGMAGVIYGGLGATGSQHAKRMLAYSTLAQVGFILAAIGWGTPLALAAAVIFAVNHSLVKAAMLMLAGVMASRAPVKSASFAVLQGVGKKLPAGGALFLLGGLSLAGIPPTNGFISKLAVFSSGIAAGQWAALALLGLGSVLTLIYTIRAFMRIWWQPAEDNQAAAPAKAAKPGDRLLAPTLLLLIALGLGLWPAPLVHLATATAEALGDPALYINAVFGR